VKKPKISKSDSDRFGRHLAMLLTRATMYKPHHPYVKQSSDILYQMAAKLLDRISPLVFSMHREQCFVDEEPLDPRVNVLRVISHFKNVGLESIAFYRGLTEQELKSFLEAYVLAPNYFDVDSMSRALVDNRIKHIKLNHVMFTKITVDEKVIPRDADQEVGWQTSNEDLDSSRKALYDMLFESALTDELQQSLTINTLLQNPTDASTNMIQLDLKSCQQSDAKDRRPGLVLLNQLQTLGKELEQGLERKGSPELSELARAVFALKRQLLEGMEAQKALDVSYANEERIRSEANELADKVLARLVKEEYKGGKMSAARLAQILRRLIPETDELKRVLPKIRRALLEEGMPLEEYSKLVRELAKELQSDDLIRVLQDSSREAGVDGKELIQEIKRNPVRVAELICLAAEVHKATGDPKLLTEVLVDYVERLGPQLALESAPNKDGDTEAHLRGVVAQLGSTIVNRFKNMDTGGDVLAQLEEKINKRLDLILEKFRNGLARSSPRAASHEDARKLNLLDMLEQTVGDNAELREVLSAVRSKVRSEGMDEKDFVQVHGEILRQIQMRRQQQGKKRARPGLLQPQGVRYFLGKEMARAKRYNVPFSVLCLDIVGGRSQDQLPSDPTAQQDLIEAILNKLAIILRDADVLGQLEKGRMVVLLPMTGGKHARFVLRRCLKLLNSEPVLVDRISLSPKITGVAHGFDPSMKPDVDAFVKAATRELEHMISRVRNLDMFL
jgi:GGDEF domain-containing protein/molybdenum-dependent DNA-binding transcriptional regulator ModE